MIHESLQNAPSIAREAKGLTQSLKESLKKHEPWDREIEFQRSNLRRQYLQLIFVHPYSKESKDADHSLWMTTSYYNIAAYKQRIGAADAVAHQSGKESHGRGRGHQHHDSHGKPPGVVEHRKLVHRFRQFLAEEEKFWTSLIVRVVRVFGLDDARSALATLGIPTAEPAGLETSPSRSDRRNVFPAEDATSTPSPAQKEQKLVMLSKALVCLGDIARYREHYNESGGRPRAGKDFHDDSKSPGRGRGGRRGGLEQPPRPRNYNKAQECYERARLLVPDVGNACHQLAILANYQQDPFASILHYYRAMCVKHPYDTAAANLDSTLNRNLEGYRLASTKLVAGTSDTSQSPKIRVERFKKSLVALHGLWRLEPADADAILPGHAASVVAAFSSLVSERVLPTDVIWKTLVLAFGALWRFRILRDPNAKRDIRHGFAIIEARILSHILSIVRTLFQIGNVQLTDASTSPEPAVNGLPAGIGELQADLSQNITAVFRRTLPALRIGSKWVNVHFGYLTEASTRLEAAETDTTIPVIISEFWASYTAFLSLLGNIFPVEKLPKMTSPLEEDVDVNGFSPLKRAMFDPSASSASGLEPGQSQVHPNEEQLMRIADLLEDAVAISKFVDSPVELQSNRSARHPSKPAEGEAAMQQQPLLLSPENVPAITVPFFQEHTHDNMTLDMSDELDADVHSEVDDDNATVSTRTEDDPVNLAMHAQLASDDEEDEMDEQVLYPKQNRPPPIVPVSTHNSFSTPSAHTKPLSPPKPLTAEDLVNEMMRPRGSDPLFARSQPAGPPTLLFGSGSHSAPTSIWSTTTLDPASLAANNLRVTGYPGAQSRATPPLHGSGLVPSAPVLPVTPPRSRYGHQRQASQPLTYQPTSPTHQGPWPSQGSSHPTLSQAQSQPRHTLSPPSAPFVPQQPMIPAWSFHAPSPPFKQQQVLGVPGASHPHLVQLPAFPTAPNQASLPSHRTWSYSGAGSLNGLGAPLGPFATDLPYVPSRQEQLQRPGTWTPS